MIRKYYIQVQFSLSSMYKYFSENTRAAIIVSITNDLWVPFFIPCLFVACCITVMSSCNYIDFQAV